MSRNRQLIPNHEPIQATKIKTNRTPLGRQGLTHSRPWEKEKENKSPKAKARSAPTTSRTKHGNVQGLPWLPSKLKPQAQATQPPIWSLGCNLQGALDSADVCQGFNSCMPLVQVIKIAEGYFDEKSSPWKQPQTFREQDITGQRWSTH